MEAGDLDRELHQHIGHSDPDLDQPQREREAGDAAQARCVACGAAEGGQRAHQQHGIPAVQEMDSHGAFEAREPDAGVAGRPLGAGEAGVARGDQPAEQHLEQQQRRGDGQHAPGGTRHAPGGSAPAAQ